MNAEQSTLTYEVTHFRMSLPWSCIDCIPFSAFDSKAFNFHLNHPPRVVVVLTAYSLVVNDQLSISSGVAKHYTPTKRNKSRHCKRAIRALQVD